jgi:penicillin-binding protein 1C
MKKLSHLLVASAALAIAGAAAFVALPLPSGLLDRRPVAAVRFTDRTGGLLREVASRADGRSVPLPRAEPIPPLVRAAFVAAEDARFERHPGVDPLALARAAWQLASRRRVVSGASTLTMQLARELVPHPRTLGGKIREALWALRLDAHLGKDEILRAHLDRVPLGRDLFGIEAASALYFGRPARTLSAGQAALLAGMSRAPAAHDPYRRPAAAKARMRAVLGRMERLGFLDPAAAQVAARAPLDLVPPARNFAAPHLVDALARELAAFGIDAAALVETAIDPALQRDVEEILRSELATDPRLENGAVIVVDNATGEVLAYAGSADFLDDEREGQNDGVRALRQPGSALKPFAYGLGLARGFTAASLLSDVETHLATPSGDWVPRNYDRRMHGPVRLRAALQNSYNVSAVRLADALGPEAVLRTLRRAGFASLSRGAETYGSGVVLGNGDVSLRELARAYRGLARGGVVEPLVEVRRAEDGAGAELLVRRELRARRFLPADATALLADVLSDEVARAPAFGLVNALRLPFPVAAKTGTSHAYVDNWTAGFTAERTVAVWVGSFDGRPMHGVSGITGAAPIFGRAMVRAMRGIRPAPLVDRSRFVHAKVCALSGKRAGPRCPAALDEVFLPGTAPSEGCDMHREGGLALRPEHLAWARAEGIEAEGVYAAETSTRVASSTSTSTPTSTSTSISISISTLTSILAPTGTQARTSASSSAPAVRILRPAEGDEYLVESGYPDGAQAIAVRLALPAGIRSARLRIGDETLVLVPPFDARVPARPGTHTLEVLLPGESAPAASVRFTVRGEGT